MEEENHENNVIHENHENNEIHEKQEIVERELTKWNAEPEPPNKEPQPQPKPQELDQDIAISAADLSDSDVSSISEDELEESDTDTQSAPIESLGELENKYVENLEFIKKMVRIYSTDIGLAKEFYYQEKLDFDLATELGQKSLRELIRKYLEGLQWVLFYYYRGVQHWGWFYPYHYAPLISDIRNTSKLLQGHDCITFSHLKEENHPLSPFEQLICILPKSSRGLIPRIYHSLYERDSPIIDLYPTTFEVDFNGRILAWEAINLIPFIDLERILRAIEGVMGGCAVSIGDISDISDTHTSNAMDVDLGTISLLHTQGEDIQENITADDGLQGYIVMSEEEAARNIHGPEFDYSYITAYELKDVPSTITGLPDISPNFCLRQDVRVKRKTVGHKVLTFSPVIPRGTLY